MTDQNAASSNLERGDRVEELKPCPFCGSEPLFIEPASDNWHTYSIICEGCQKPLRPMASISEDREEAIGAWNTRQSPEAVTDELIQAATKLDNFAWSCVSTDCDESREYLQSLIDALRAALLKVSPPKQDSANAHG